MPIPDQPISDDVRRALAASLLKVAAADQAAIQALDVSRPWATASARAILDDLEAARRLFEQTPPPPPPPDVTVGEGVVEVLATEFRPAEGPPTVAPLWGIPIRLDPGLPRGVARIEVEDRVDYFVVIDDEEARAAVALLRARDAARHAAAEVIRRHFVDSVLRPRPPAPGDAIRITGI